MIYLFKKKTSLGKQNAGINGEWNSVTGTENKRITSSKRRILDKELIRKELNEA